MTGKSAARSIRLRITALTVLFTLVLSIAFGSASFYLFRSYARSSVLRAAEFNLQLVAHLVEQDLIELNSIARQQALDWALAEYLDADAPTRRQALDVFDDMSTLTSHSRSYTYLQRFLATDGNDRIIHVFSGTSATPLTAYNLHLLPGLDSPAESIWQQAFHDPLLSGSAPDSLLAVQPVYRPRTRERIGTVYLTASARVITDRLTSYNDTGSGPVYLRTQTGIWLLEDGHLTKSELNITSSQRDTVTARASSTLIQDVRTENGGSYTLVTCPIGSFDISLTHMVSTSDLFAQQALLWGMIGCGVLLVLLMGLGLFFYLNRLIVQPVTQLRQRMGRIAGGDFSADPNIEWPTELGDVGRGVNQLSRDVQELMDKRVADEQERQSLEYKMLQNQMNPHFIYNTLNSIKWMATLQGANGIAEMTTAFSRLLKSIAKGNRALNTLREEFALLNDYCTIQQYRYGGAITIEIAEISDESLCECLIPCFSLQPLVENAIFHGIEPKGGVGSVWLHIKQEQNSDIIIAIEDDGVGMSQDAIAAVFNGEDPSTGKYRQIGVRNVHRRIQYAFGPQYGLSIQSELQQYTRVEIRIPFRASPTDNGEEPQHD